MMVNDDQNAALRKLPAVDGLLKQPAVANLLDEYPRGELLWAVRIVLNERRVALLAGQDVDLDVPSLALAIREKLQERSQPYLRRVINATGIVLHTGLGAGTIGGGGRCGNRGCLSGILQPRATARYGPTRRSA